MTGECTLDSYVESIESWFNNFLSESNGSVGYLSAYAIYAFLRSINDISLYCTHKEILTTSKMIAKNINSARTRNKQKLAIFINTGDIAAYLVNVSKLKRGPIETIIKYLLTPLPTNRPMVFYISLYDKRPYLIVKTNITRIKLVNTVSEVERYKTPLLILARSPSIRGLSLGDTYLRVNKRAYMKSRLKLLLCKNVEELYDENIKNRVKIVSFKNIIELRKKISDCN